MTTPQQKLLIVDPDAGARSRLRNALWSVFGKIGIDQAQTFRDALTLLKDEETSYQGVFLASHDQKELLSEFYNELKELLPEETPFLIICLKSQHQENTYVAEIYLQGIEGVICEPYSAERIRELIEISRERATSEEEDGTSSSSVADFLVGGAMQQLDLLSEHKVRGAKGGGFALRSLKEISESLKKIAGDIPDQLPEILIRKFQNAKPAKRAHVPTATGKPKEEVHHPGKIVGLLMQKRNVPKENLLPFLDMDETALDLFLSEQVPVSEKIAEGLFRALGETPQFWLQLQANYDEAHPAAEPSPQEAG